MSADNTILVAKFPDGWRVLHTQGAESIEDDNHTPQNVVDCLRLLAFGSLIVFDNEDDAFVYAKELYQEIGYVEYGIRWCEYDRPLPDITPDDATRTIEDFFENL